jgi:hypothetical protein
MIMAKKETEITMVKIDHLKFLLKILVKFLLLCLWVQKMAWLLRETHNGHSTRCRMLLNSIRSTRWDTCHSWSEMI